MSNNTEHIPTGHEEGEPEKKGTGGLLSPIGDPLGTFSIPLDFLSLCLTYSLTNNPGKGLETGLKPVGAGLGKITEPLGNALGGATRGALGPLLGNDDERMEIVGGNNKDSYNKPEKIAGKEQTGENPLGLDQTGRWGFRDEK
jgi:hypothetical protein